jgi:hypothetical protein
LVGRQADGIADALGLQQLVDLGLGEGGIGPEVEGGAPVAVAGDHRLQHQAPVFGAVGIAGPKEAALQVAELVEQEQRVIAGAAEVAVPDRAFLLAVGRALRAVHVEDDRAGQLAFVDAVDPGARQIREGFQVDVRRQPIGLEAPHLAARRGHTIEPLTADDGPHGGVAGELLGVVHVFIAGEPPEHRLAKQPTQLMARVLAAATIQEPGDRDIGEPEGIVELTVGEQAAVGADPGAMEFELDPAVEGGPQRRLSRFTRRVPHDHAPSIVSTS